MPQVNAVRPLADPAQWLHIECPPEPGSLAGSRPHYDEHGDGGDLKAAHEALGAALAKSDAQPTERCEAGGANGGQTQLLPDRKLAGRHECIDFTRSWRQRARERNAEQQTEHVGVGAEVDARRGGTLREERAHPQCRAPAKQREEEHSGGARAHAQREDQHEGEQHVELLLDRERPGVAKELGILPGEIVGAERDVYPVRNEERSTHELCPDAHQQLLAGEERCAGAHEQHEDESRQQSPSAPPPEVSECDSARAPVLGEQQRGDQEPADDEEHVDAEEAALQRRRKQVIDDDHANRDCAKTVEPAEA